MKIVIGKEVAEEMLKNIYEELCIDPDMLNDDEDGKSSEKKLISALMQGRLEFKDECFTQTLIKPISAGKKDISSLIIKEPTGAQLRGMSQVKKKNDDVGKAMSILGEVTGLGLPVINKLGSRDLMLAVGVVSLFL